MPGRGELEGAYLATDYLVYVEEEFVLKIDEYSPRLRQVYSQFGVSSALHITAWNPCSQYLAAADNERRQYLLLQAVVESKLPYCRGFGRDPMGEWEGEEHLVVFGADKEFAARLARAFEQNAVVWCGESAVPELMWFVH